MCTFNKISIKQEQQPYEECTSDSENSSNCNSSIISNNDNDNSNQDFNVICAKGRFAFNNSGNRRFRRIVQCHLEEYANATNKSEKSKVVTAIIEEVQRRGNFLRQDSKSGDLVPVTDRLRREKVGQGLRDALHTKYKSSTKAKKRVRLAERKEQDDLIHTMLSSNKKINATISNVIHQVSTSKSDSQLMRVFVDANRNILQQLKVNNFGTSLIAAANNGRREEKVMSASFDTFAPLQCDYPTSLYNNEFRPILQSLLEA